MNNNRIRPIFIFQVTFCEEFKFLEIPHTQWIQMTKEQRMSKVKKAMTHPISIKKVQTSHDPVVANASNYRKLSVNWSDTSASITHLQPSRVKDIWGKAEIILNSDNFVLPEAGNSCARQVASSVSSEGVVVPPHFVYYKKCGSGIQVHCDCHIYKSLPNVCQHSLAAAEDMGVLHNYLEWLKKKKTTGLNLSMLISKELPKSAGKKSSTSQRKGIPKGKKKTVLSEVNGINTTLSDINIPADSPAQSSHSPKPTSYVTTPPMSNPVLSSHHCFHLHTFHMVHHQQIIAITSTVTNLAFHRT